MEHHADFNVPWCRALLTSPIEVTNEQGRQAALPFHTTVSNSLFSQTLLTDSAVRAMINFRRRLPSRQDGPESVSESESESEYEYEYCILVSLGDGVDGMTGRAHGGFNALLLDHVTGFAASQVQGQGPEPPATANMNLDYRAPVPTPCLVLCRAEILGVEGRKVRVKGSVEDGRGKVYAVGTVLYVLPRGGRM